ncbi:MAG: ParB/RepB/Spo0J family partition protein [Bacilli bacterium]|nr:ParB/RepB/Spo0J family partition protein [Bacilli bacterium]
MQGEEVVYLYLDDIIPNRFQPREVFEEKPLKELAVSIKEHGVIQPIIVRKVNDKYEIIAGERRYKASALAGLTKIPAIIRELDDKESSKVALLENLQRKNLNPIEEAKTYQKILEIDEMTQEELAKTMGKSQSSVANKLRLLSLSDEIQQALLQDKISERHARTLLNVKDPREQQELLNEIINTKMTVRQLESKIKKDQPSSESIIQDTTVSSHSLENMNIKDSKPILKQDNYISSNPLIPSFLTGEAEQKEEPLLISATGENLMDKREEPELLINEENTEKENEISPQKFINFGEIDDTEDEDLIQVNDGMLLGSITSKEDSSINVNDLNANIQNVSPSQKGASNADLDSLLRINTDPILSNANNNSSSEENNNFKFFSPVQEALKESEKEETKTSEDYFKAPDLINVDIPGEIATSPTNNVSLSQVTYDSINENKPIQSIDFNTNRSLQSSIEMIRDVIKKIESNGLKVDSDEMNLENSYQVIIKIEK